MLTLLNIFRKNTLIALTSAALALSVAGVGCSHHKVKLDQSQTKADASGVASMWISMIKEKGRKFDATLHIRNESKDKIIILLGDMDCSQGSETGTLKYTFFNTGERIIDFGPNQEKSFIVVCKLPERTKTGEFAITAHHIFDNPSGDRTHPGKEIAHDLTTRYSPGGAKSR